MNLPRSLTAALDDLLTRAFAEEGEDITSLADLGRGCGARARKWSVASAPSFRELPSCLRLFAFLSPPASRGAPRD